MIYVLLITLSIYLMFSLNCISGSQLTAVCVKNLPENVPARISIGARTFRELVTNSDVFVDRSLLIKTILSSSEKVLLINYPRKWGKSVNLDMIREFLEINEDENGNRNRIAAVNESFGYRLFKHGEIISSTGQIQTFTPSFLISKCEDIFQRHQGKYPVIYLDLSGLSNNNFAFMFKGLKKRIHTVFARHSYMLKVFERNLAKVQHDPLEKIYVQVRQNFFQQILREEGLEQDIVESLMFLSEILYKHFNRKVFILVDGYDDVLLNLLFNSTATERVAQKTMKFFSSLYSRCMENNVYLEKGILTGVWSIVVDGLQSSLNSSDGIYKFKNDLIQFYGFSEIDVNTLIEYFKLPTNAKEIAHDWCSGYKEGNKFFNHVVSNPRCVFNVLNQKNFSSYFGDKYQAFNDNPDILERVLLHNNTEKFRNIILSLIRGQPIALSRIFFQFWEYNFFPFREAIVLNRKWMKMNTALLSFLYMSGYLTINSNPPSNSTNVYFTLRLPNKEMMKEVSYKLMVFVKASSAVSPSKIEEAAISMIECIQNNDNNSYLEETQKIMQQMLGPFHIHTFKRNQRALSLIIPLLLARMSLHITGSEVFHTKTTEGILVKDALGIFITFKHNDLSPPKTLFQNAKFDFKHIMVKKKVKDENLGNVLLKFIAMNLLNNGTLLMFMETEMINLDEVQKN